MRYSKSTGAGWLTAESFWKTL